MKKNVLFLSLLFLGVQVAMGQPSTSAPTPPARTAPKVISIFSNAYTNLAGTDFNPNWGQSTVVTTEEYVTGDQVLKYANLNYQGTALQGSVNALSMTHLHVDVWTSDETSFQITPISSDPTSEKLVAKPITINAWTSLDIPLTEFTGVDFSKIFQFKIVGSGGKTVYLDNLYFYDETTTTDTQAPTNFTASLGTVASDAVTLLLKATDDSGGINYTISYGTGPTVLTTAGVSNTEKAFLITGLEASTTYTFSIEAKDPTGNSAANNPLTVVAITLAAIPPAPVPTAAAGNVISIYSDTYTNIAGTNFYPWWNQTTVVSEVLLSGNKTLKYSTFNYMGIELGAHVDASTMTHLHVDIYPTTETKVNLTPISPGQEKSTSLGTLTANQWNSVDIPLTSYDNVNLADILQFKFDQGTGGIFYMDNLYFINKTGTGTDNIKSTKLEIYPNPTVDNLNIRSEKAISKVYINNLLGQNLKVVEVNGSDCVINLREFTSGNYILMIKDVDGNSVAKKIQKQ